MAKELGIEETPIPEVPPAAIDTDTLGGDLPVDSPEVYRAFWEEQVGGMTQATKEQYEKMRGIPYAKDPTYGLPVYVGSGTSGKPDNATYFQDGSLISNLKIGETPATVTIAPDNSIHLSVDGSLGRTGLGAFRVMNAIVPKLNKLLEIHSAKNPDTTYTFMSNDEKKFPLFRRYAERAGFEMVGRFSFKLPQQGTALAPEDVNAREQVASLAESPEAQEAAAQIDDEMPDFVAQAVAETQDEAAEAIARYEEEMANVARDAQMADEFADEQATAAEQAEVQAKIDAVRAEAEAPPTINRVLDGNALYTAPPTVPNFPATQDTMAYHVATEEEVKALREGGRLASKAARTGEGGNAVAWTRGGSNVGFPTAANKGKFVIVTPAENLDKRTKPVFKGDVAQVWQSDGTKWVEVTSDIKKPTDRVPTRAEWSRRIQSQRKKQGLRGNPEQRVIRAFHETAVGEYFSGRGGILFRKKAEEMGKLEPGSPVKGAYDAVKELSSVSKNPKIINSIFSSDPNSRTPDQWAIELYEDGVIKETGYEAFWNALRDAIAMAEDAVQREFEADVAEDLTDELLTSISKGDPQNDTEVEPDSLARGDVLIIDGRAFTVVTSLGSDLVLKGDGKFEKELTLPKAILEGAFVDDVRRGNPADAARPAAPASTPEEQARRAADTAKKQAEARKREEAFNAKRKAEQEAKQKAKAEAEAAAKPKAPVTEMDRKADAAKELFADDGGFKLAQQTTQDGEAEAKRKADAAAAQEAADKAQQKLELEEEPEPETPALTETDTRTPEQKLKDALKLADKVVAIVTKGQPDSVKEAARGAIVEQIAKDARAGVITPEALMFTIAKRAASTRGVTRKGERKAVAEGNVGTLDTGTPVVDSALQPDEEVEEDERRERLNAMMDQLTPQERDVMRRVIAGQDNPEIAEALGITAASVATIKTRAFKKLQKAATRTGPVVSTKSYVPPAPFNPSLGTDQQLLDAMIDRYVAKFGGTRPKLKVFRGKLSKQQKDAVELGKFFGRRVIFLSGLRTNGLFDPATPGVIYLADDSERHTALVFYHELLHSLRTSDPKAYQRFKDAVKVDLDAYVAKHARRKEDTEDATREEFLADFLSDRATDPDFWTNLAQKDKNLFEKIIELLQSLFRSVQVGRMGTEQFVSDLAAADAAVLQALLTLQLQGAEINQRQQGDVKTDRREMSAAETSPVYQEALDEINGTSVSKYHPEIEGSTFIEQKMPFGTRALIGKVYSYVGGGRSGSSEAGEHRGGYDVYDTRAISPESMNDAKVIGRVELFEDVRDGAIKKLVVIEVAKNERRKGHATRILREILANTRGESLEVRDIRNKNLTKLIKQNFTGVTANNAGVVNAIIPKEGNLDTGISSAASNDIRFDRRKSDVAKPIPASEGGNLTPSTWGSLEKAGYLPDAAEKTQITTTAATYEKIVATHAKPGMLVLDYAAGRGAGTLAAKRIGAEQGFTVVGYEPFSNPATRVVAPEYEGVGASEKIPNGSVDLVINNAVLNVVPESTGRTILADIYAKLAPGGTAFVNVMGWNNIKGRLANPQTKLVGPREVLTSKGTFQKGYTFDSLAALIRDVLPEAQVERTGYGDVGFKITKAPVGQSLRFDRREGDPVQTGGRDNRFFNRAPSQLKVLEDIVRDTFDPDTVPKDAAGIRAAVRFLGKLLDPAYVKMLTERAIREGVPPLEAAIIPGVGRSAVLSYAAQLAESNPKEADKLIAKVEKAHRDLRFLFGEAIDASLIGKALRSLRAFAGGSIQRMFTMDRMGREEFAKEKFGQDAVDASDAVRNAELNGQEAEELADKITAELDPEVQERIAKAEAAARAAWVKVYELYKRLIRANDTLKTDRREGDAPESRMSPEDAFREWEKLVLSPDASLEDIAAGFDNLIEADNTNLDAAERDAITRAKRKTLDAINAKEEATGSTDTRNQLDIMAKRHIGKVTRAKRQNDTEQAKRRQAFQDLVNNKDLGFNEFLAEYVRLGGTVEVGSDLYDANVKLLREGKSTAEREADAKVRAARRTVDEMVESMVTNVLTPKREPARPTTANLTPDRVMREYANPKIAASPEALVAQLREFTDGDGNRLFSEDHVATLVTAAGMARRMRVEADAARKAADAEAKIAERTELEKAEAERLAQVAEDRAEREAENLQDLVDTLVGDLLYPSKAGTRATAETDTPRKAIARFKNLDTGGSPTILAAELRAFKNADGTQQFSEDQIATLVTAAELARESDMAARRADRLAKFDAAEQRKSQIEIAAAERKARQLEERSRRAEEQLKEQVDRMVADLVAPAKREPARPTSDNDTPRKLLNRATNPDSVRIDSDVLAQMLREFKRKDGSQLLSEDQIAALVTAAEVARAARVEAESVKAIERDKKAADKRRAAELKQAGSIFSPRTRQARDPEKRSLRQIILEDFINNPVRKIMTQAERIEFAKEILREKTDLSEADIARVAVQMEGQLAKAIEELKLKAVTPFLKSLGQKALSREQIAQAIRLEVLDPGKDFVSSVAAIAGWDGLTDAEYRRLVELQRKIDIAGSDSRVATRYIAEQERIIHLAAGIPPKWKDRINTYLRGNIFSAITSLTIGPVVGAWELFSSVLGESFVSVGRNKLNLIGTIAEWGAIIRAFASNTSRGFREAWEVAKTGTTFIEQVKLEQAKMDEKGEGKIFVDPATRTYDDAMKKMKKAIEGFQKNPTKATSEILWQAIRGYILSAGRLTFRALFMADAAVTKINASAMAEIFKYREIKRLGITKEQVREIQNEVERLVDSQRMFLQTELGLSGNILEIEIQDRIEGAMLQALTMQGAQGLDTILTEAASDIQDRIGTGETSKATLIGRMNESASTFVNNFAVPIAGVLPAIRTNGNIIDAAMWYMPVVGLYRAIRYNKMTTAERQAVFPNIRADWQFRRKQIMAAFTNGASLAIFGLLMANKDLPEDEKWFRFTGAYPVGDKGTQALWELKGYSEYTLYVGTLPGVKMDRGFGQAFLPAFVTASMLVEASDGVTGKEALKNTVALAELYLPGFSQAKGRFKAADSTYNAERFIENQVTMFVPLSGLLQTPRRVGEPVDKRNTDASLLEANPFWVSADAGVMRMRNILGEPLESESSPYSWMSKIGIPLQFRPVKEGRDPVKRQIMEDFYQYKYAGGKVTLNDFRKAYGETATTSQYQAFLQARADLFVPRYQKVRERLVARPEDYAGRVGDLWENASIRAARNLGLEKQRKAK
jgi:RNA polymerase sigma factor (sigma-70 family)